MYIHIYIFGVLNCQYVSLIYTKRRYDTNYIVHHIVSIVLYK